MPELQEMKKQAQSLLDRKDYKAAIEAYDELARFALSEQNESEASAAFNNAGFACRLLDQYDAAKRYFEYSLQIDRKIGNKDSPEIAITLQHLGRISFLKEDLQSCWKYWTEALEIWKIVCRVEPGYIHYLVKFPPKSGSSALHVNPEGQSTRRRSRSKWARPYIWRLMNLRRLTWPSVWPLLQGSSKAARTAA
jgi:tetratricopeptide (TPR) repeat protein